MYVVTDNNGCKLVTMVTKPAAFNVQYITVAIIARLRVVALCSLNAGSANHWIKVHHSLHGCQDC